MRLLITALLVLIACHPQGELIKAYDAKCFTPCYGGDPANAGKGICEEGIWQCADVDSDPVCVGWVAPQDE